jgi:nitrite reductase (NO-forming)
MSITKETAHYVEPTLGRSTHPVGSAHSYPSVRLVAGLRVAFGLVWAIDAVLKWLPGFRDGFGTMLDQAAKAQPGWLRPVFDLWTGIPHGEAMAMAYASAATETFLALALITGFARKSVYLLGAGYSLLIWAVGEGFGAPYHPGSTDVGAAIIYTFVFTAIFLVDRFGPNTYSLDAYLEKQIFWWHRVAEPASVGIGDISKNLPPE